MKLKSLTLKISLSVISLLVTLFVIEIALRLKDPAGWEYLANNLNDASLFEADPELTHKIRANASLTIRTPEYVTKIKTNSLGIRGPELGSKNGYRVLTVGDSFTFAGQVDEKYTFQNLLSKSLGIEVINAGIDDFSTWEAAIIAGRLAPVVKADAILHILFLGNDLIDNNAFSHIQKKESANPPHQLPWYSVFTKHSFIAYYLQIFIKPPSDRKNDLEFFVDENKLRPLLDPTRQALWSLESVCKANNARCYVAIAPPTFLVHTERANATFEYFGLQSPKDLDLVSREVMKIIPKGITSLDLTLGLRKASGDDLYFKFDDHWNKKGHQVVADELTGLLATK